MRQVANKFIQEKEAWSSDANSELNQIKGKLEQAMLDLNESKKQQADQAALISSQSLELVDLKHTVHALNEKLANQKI